MHDEAKIPLPYRWRNRALQIRREDYVGSEQLRRFTGHAVVNVEFDRQLVAIAAECDKEALGQAVEGMHEQQDAHQTATGSTPRRYL